jgi:hypothetical protein
LSLIIPYRAYIIIQFKIFAPLPSRLAPRITATHRDSLLSPLAVTEVGLSPTCLIQLCWTRCTSTIKSNNNFTRLLPSYQSISLSWFDSPFAPKTAKCISQPTSKKTPLKTPKKPIGIGFFACASFLTSNGG